MIHHVLGRDECTEPDCEAIEMVHTFSIDCETVGCTCDVLIANAV